MWRTSDDFWEEWPLLEVQLARLEKCSAYTGDVRWLEADMLPLGA